MPIYEYGCKNCGDVQEVMQKLDDLPPKTCPVCKEGPMVKLLSRTAFILKGQGWYTTDFRDSGKKPVSSAASESSSSESSSASCAPTGCSKPGCDA